MRRPITGKKVIVYDRYRFAIPLKGYIVALSKSNDGVQVQLLESNNKTYPVGCTIWVHSKQLQRIREVII
jgi:hypothetical protein